MLERKGDKNTRLRSNHLEYSKCRDSVCMLLGAAAREVDSNGPIIAREMTLDLAGSLSSMVWWRCVRPFSCPLPVGCDAGGWTVVFTCFSVSLRCNLHRLQLAGVMNPQTWRLGCRKEWKVVRTSQAWTRQNDARAQTFQHQLHEAASSMELNTRLDESSRPGPVSPARVD